MFLITTTVQPSEKYCFTFMHKNRGEKKNPRKGDQNVAERIRGDVQPN